jgi:hypothetical protein
MYHNVEDLFKNEKLAMMVSSEDKNIVCFPNILNAQFECNINSPLALISTTILKAAFNIEGITLIPNKEHTELAINFNGQEIQRFVICEIDNNTVGISKLVKETIHKYNEIDKVTYVFLDKEAFLSQNNPFEQYLKYLANFNINSEDTYQLEIIRKEFLAKTGIYIEEYNNKKDLLDDMSIVSSLDISHHNTFSHPIIYDVKNYNSIKEDLNRLGVADIHIQSGFKYAIQTPINSFNPITNVSNYRDLNLEEVVENKLYPFIDTLIQRAKTYYQAQEELNQHINPALDEMATIEMEAALIDNGNAKKLYSLKEHRKLVIQQKKEIFTYYQEVEGKDEQLLCINSKGTCLGNGQHSASTFQIIDLLLNNTDESAILLNERFNLSRERLVNLFNVSNNNVYVKIKNKLLERISNANLSEEEFLLFLNKSVIKIDWKISMKPASLTSDITVDNAQKEQDKSDDWINENKDDVALFLTNYHRVNKKVIDRYRGYKKHKTNSNLAKFDVVMDIRGIKTPDLSPTVAFDSILPTNLNEIFKYMTFILPQNRNLTPIDGKYTETYNKKNVASRNNLRNIYQNESTEESLHLFWAEVIDGRDFKKPGSKATFDTFMGCFSTQDIQRSTAKNNKYETFLSMGREALKNSIGEAILQKIPAIILFKKMAEAYYVKWEMSIGATNKEVISKEGFLNLAFFACVSKVGKKNFSLDFIEKNGELILKDICNGMAELYANNYDPEIKTDKLKRERKFSDSTRKEVKKLMINLFEPYQAVEDKKIPCNLSLELNNHGFKSVDDAIINKSATIQPKFETTFGKIESTTKSKKKKINF